MAVSGSRDFILTRNDIIEAALRKIGAIAEDDSASPYQIKTGSQALNVMIQSWYNKEIFLWTQQDDTQLLTADTIQYTLDAEVIGIDQVFLRQNQADVPVYPMTREEYKMLPDKIVDRGESNRYFLDIQLAAPVLYLWPKPDKSTALAAGTDTNNYVCIKDHTSSTDDKPITGSDYATFWELITTESGGGVWAADAEYRSDILYYTKYIRLQDFSTGPDNPDFPVRWYKAVIYGLAVDLAPEFAIRGTDWDKLGILASEAFDEAQAFDGDRGNLQITPYVSKRRIR